MNALYEAVGVSIPRASCAACARAEVRGQTAIVQTGDVIDIGFQTAAPNGPPGSQIISAFTYDTYWTLTNGAIQEEVQTLQYDFMASEFMGQDTWHQVLDNIRFQLLQSNLQIVAYILWENVVFDVSIPSDICIPGTTICWTPPLAGQSVVQVVQYRLWMMIIPFVGPVPMVSAAVAPFVFVIPIMTILGLTLAFVVATFTIIAAVQIFQGKMTLGQAISPIGDLAKIPGETIAAPIQAVSWPFFALGIAMVAAGIFIPMAAGSVGVTAPIGPGRVDVQAGSGGGGGRRR